MMEPLGIKLVEQEKLFSQIFLPKPTLFQVRVCQSIDGADGVYSIPITEFKKLQKICFNWWGNVFEIAGTCEIKIEVKFISENYIKGFRFHEPESLYKQNYTGDPRDDSDKWQKEAEQKAKNILELKLHYTTLKQIIAGVTPLSSDFYNHLMKTLGHHEQCVEIQSVGIDLPDFFSVDKYLFHYGRLKGLHLWELVDARVISTDAVYGLSRLETDIETAAAEDGVESITKDINF